MSTTTIGINATDTIVYLDVDDDGIRSILLYDTGHDIEIHLYGDPPILARVLQDAAVLNRSNP